jgi:hypothetical protein
VGAFEIPPDTDRVRVTSVEVLSDDWYVLRKVGFDLRFGDGRWTLQHREAGEVQRVFDVAQLHGVV